MNRQDARDLHISGIANMSGGVFKNVIVDGIGTINGDLECHDFVCKGKSAIKGDVKTAAADIHGTANIAGAIKSRKIQLNGYARIKGNLFCEEAALTGGVAIDGDCEAESFAVKGGFTIKGLLNAGEINIMMHKKCRVKEIGGEMITVREGKRHIPIINLLGPIFASRLIAETIEGDIIQLENTKAKMVRGNHVTVGTGCDIERIEYRGEFFHDPGSRIGSYAKL